MCFKTLSSLIFTKFIWNPLIEFLQFINFLEMVWYCWNADIYRLRHFSDILTWFLFSKCFQMLGVNCRWTFSTSWSSRFISSLWNSEFSILLSDHYWILHSMFCWYWQLFVLFCWVLWHINLCRLFNAKSIFMFYLKQFSLAWVHSLIVKNISISNYSSSYI